MNGITPNGAKTFVAAATITKGQTVKFSSGKVTPCTAATDVAIGVALDGAGANENVPVAVLGSYTGTVELLAGGAISQGAQIAANRTATAASTDVIVGVALEAATASGQLIEVAHAVAHVK